MGGIRWIEPLEFNGVKLMSAGFAKLQGTDVSSSEANKTVLRGPMVSRLVQQLIEQVPSVCSLSFTSQ
jgi:hypothetical protein